MILPRPAGFWIRAVAALIDFIVLAMVRASLGALAARVWRADVGALSLRGMVIVCTALIVVLYVVAILTIVLIHETGHFVFAKAFRITTAP